MPWDKSLLGFRMSRMHNGHVPGVEGRGGGEARDHFWLAGAWESHRGCRSPPVDQGCLPWRSCIQLHAATSHDIHTLPPSHLFFHFSPSRSPGIPGRFNTPRCGGGWTMPPPGGRARKHKLPTPPFRPGTGKETDACGSRSFLSFARVK
jgi:hypothetical protein